MIIAVEMNIDDEDLRSWTFENMHWADPYSTEAIEGYLDNEGIDGTLINIL